MSKASNKVNAIAGYSNRYKRLPGDQKANSAQKQPSSLKLPQIPESTRKFQSLSPKRSLLKQNLLIKSIDDKANVYEQAIKDHLGLSKDSPESSPFSKIKSSLKPPRYTKSIDISLTNNLASIEQQESLITNSIKNLDRAKKRLPKSKANIVMKSSDLEDKEIKLIQDSLSQINSLLNRILKKSPSKYK